ncbi:unnamed protein product [Trichogramma brassicae]|uniref:Uncharacterized protein n=1 Tax=Trichogramma brassicae TaxID=86971 RepID=A0A6H5J1Z5_9HYME|nr:unnamed protein product [Trichogramma brassicae]
MRLAAMLNDIYATLRSRGTGVPFLPAASPQRLETSQRRSCAIPRHIRSLGRLQRHLGDSGLHSTAGPARERVARAPGDVAVLALAGPQSGPGPPRTRLHPGARPRARGDARPVRDPVRLAGDPAGQARQVPGPLVTELRDDDDERLDAARPRHRHRRQAHRRADAPAAPTPAQEGLARRLSRARSVHGSGSSSSSSSSGSNGDGGLEVLRPGPASPSSSAASAAAGQLEPRRRAPGLRLSHGHRPAGQLRAADDAQHDPREEEQPSDRQLPAAAAEWHPREEKQQGAERLLHRLEERLDREQGRIYHWTLLNGRTQYPT